MATGPRYRVPFRRKREGKTDYRKRPKLVMSRKPRLVVRKSLKHAIVQLIEYHPKGDITIVSAHSKELESFGWKGNTSNLKAFYLTGLICGKKAVDKKYKEAVFDSGLSSLIKKSNIFAALKGSLDAGMKIPYGSDVLPEDDRIKGTDVEKIIKKINSGGKK
ncbi:MAG: 50S ribosomal protein L18 [Candidatus Hydrothermarchaeales archaeon]